jgi:predicted nucleic acid-binding protein
MILLDTNVVSEPFRPQPDLKVRVWIDAQPASTLFICTPVLAELHFGVQRLAASPRRDRLRANVDYIENDLYRGRVISFDSAAAAEYGRIVAHRTRIGRPIQQMDALIASIALVQKAVLVTRDTNDFAELDLDLVNPFSPNSAND